MKKETNIWIPWEKFSEEKIQNLIAMLFFDLGYQVKHPHKSDRANEDGADIIVNKKNEEIAIAVKVKPKQKDRDQLIELNDRPEKRKIYVYIETPTRKFSEFIEKYPSVEFFDIQKLNNFFFENDLHLFSFILFDNHPINDDLIKTKEFMFLAWEMSKDYNQDNKDKICKESFFLLWRLKDTAVVLNQTNYLIQRLFDEPFDSEDVEYSKHFIRMFVDYLDILEGKISSFRKYFEMFYLKNMGLVLNSIRKNSTSSHWFYLTSYKPLNSVENLKKELREAIKNKKHMDELDKKLSPQDKKEIEKMEEDVNKGNDVWKVINSKLKSLNMLGNGLEYIIDDIFAENFDIHGRLDIFDDLDKRRFP